MSKQRKQWGPSSPRMAHSQSSGNAQWGAAITLRALQSEAVPIRGPASYQKQGPTSPIDQRRPSRSRSDQVVYQRAPSSASGSMSSGSQGGRNDQVYSQRPSDATIKAVKPSTLGVYQPPQGVQNSINLGLKPSPMSLRAQSALGVYRPTEDISPRQLTFDGAAYFPQQSGSSPPSQVPQRPAPSLRAESSPWTSTVPAPHHHYQQQQQQQQQLYTSTLYSPDSALLSSPSSGETQSPPNSAKSNSSSQKSPYERYQPLHMQTSQEFEPVPTMSEEQRREHLRSHSMAIQAPQCNATNRHASVISIDPTRVNDVITRQRSQTESAAVRRTDQFMKEYGLHIHGDSPPHAKGGWDDDSDDEQHQQRGGMLSPSSSAAGRKMVMINEHVTSSPTSSTKSGRTGSLFKKAFYKSTNTKRATASNRGSVPRKPVPSSSPRSILRTRPPSLALGSPRMSNTSLGSNPSPSTPGSFFCADSAAMNNSTHQQEAYQKLIAQQRPSQRFSTSQPTPPVPPRRRQSVGSRKELKNGYKSEVMQAEIVPAVSSVVQSSSPPVNTSPSTVNSRLSLDGNKAEESATDETSSVNSAKLLAVQAVGPRRPSDAESIGSSYDQESWDGGSRRGSSNTLSASLLLNAPVLRTSYYRKPSLVAEQSPLLADRVLEEEEERSSADDGDDEGDDNFEDAQQDRLKVPTKYKIVRTSGDDSRELEYLDSIHVYDKTRDDLADEDSQVGDSNDDMLGLQGEQSEDVVDMLPSPSRLQACQDAQEEMETLEVNQFLANYGKQVHSVRTSGFFDSSAMTAHSWPSKEEWKDARTGKLNAAGFVASTVISTLTYLSPVHFRDLHNFEQSESIKQPATEEALFHMDALKSSAERLFLSAIPLYERIYLTGRSLWRWDSKLRSLLCCAAYFTLWYKGLLLASLFSACILAVLGGQSKRNLGDRLRMLAEQKSRARAVRQIHTNEWRDIVREAQKQRGDQDISDAAEAIRKYGLALSIVSTRLADAHERIRNMALWARTPATVRTLVILVLAALFSLTITPNMLVRIPGLVFGVAFFLLAPLVERGWLWVNGAWVDPIEIMLAGVPNAGQNATLIMKRRMQSIHDSPEKHQAEQHPPSPRERSAYVDASTNLLDDGNFPARETCFAAMYESRNGLLVVTNERLNFRAQSVDATLRRRSSTTNILLDVLLERIVRIDKITVHHADAKSTLGLRLSVRQSGNTISMHTLTDMDARDQAFNYIMALAPQRWQKQRPNFI